MLRCPGTPRRAFDATDLWQEQFPQSRSATLRAPTSDHWHLALHHIAPTFRSKRWPILMVHGLGANRLNVHYDDKLSIANAAAERGYAVYILELRGAGFSRQLSDSDIKYDWGFSEYSEIDIPTAVNKVLEHAQVDGYHALGHSMGGMLFYAEASKGSSPIKSLVSVGSPFLQEIDLAKAEAQLLRWLQKWVKGDREQRVPFKMLMGTAGKMIPLAKHLLDGTMLSLENTERTVVQRMSREGIDDIPLKLLAEFGSEIDSPGSTEAFSYERRMHDIDVPVFAIAGSSDRVAPPSSVRAALFSINSSDIRYREYGLRFGDCADYGHVDLLIGKNSRTEVFPDILNFFDELS